jgi:hypothetical protein
VVVIRRIWVNSNAGYMDFPVILNKVSQVFEEVGALLPVVYPSPGAVSTKLCRCPQILLQRPKDIADLHRRQQATAEAQAKP